MELEFDKEIDAILRKAKRGSPVDTGTLAGGHLDADELVAFAESALPDRTRQMYIAHLADCDTCRKTLSSFISINPAAAPEAAFDAVIPVLSAPWYRRLFATPNLAYVMGTLVLVFSGVVGYLVLQSGNRNKQVSVVTEKPAPATTPIVEDRASETDAAAASNSAANAATSSPIESVTKSGVAVGSATNTTTTTDEPVAGKDEIASNLPADQLNKEPVAPPSSAQPMAKPAAAMAERDDKKLETKTENEKSKTDTGANLADSSKDANADRRALREMVPSPKTGPSRMAGPKQANNQTNAQVENQVQMDGATVNQRKVEELPINGRSAAGLVAVAATRSVGGKTFSLRDGVWYDSAYAGGGTKDVRRGTDKYAKLDAGLRSIGDQITGTVVVIWNGKAYKIR